MTTQYSSRCRKIENAVVQWQAGFTLLEMVMVMLVLSILAGLTAPIFSQGLAATRVTSENLQTIEKLRYASERLAREIRQISYSGGAYSITTMTGSSLAFTKNDASSTSVSINFSGTTVTLDYPALSLTTPPTLSDEVSSLAFVYYDALNASGASTTDVAYVEFTLTLQNPVTGGNFSQRTRVALREQS